MKNNGFILFMDSGMGGLSVLKKFLQIKNDCNLIFYADTKNFPYLFLTQPLGIIMRGLENEYVSRASLEYCNKF